MPNAEFALLLVEGVYFGQGPHAAQLQPERRRGSNLHQRRRFTRRVVHLRLAGEWPPGAGAEDERGEEVGGMRNNELLHVWGSALFYA